MAQGTNFDLVRQDTKPELINLNLIIDEEVFFSVFGQQDPTFNHPAAHALLPAPGVRPLARRRQFTGGWCDRPPLMWDPRRFRWS